MNNIEKIICLLLIFLIIKNKINLNILAIVYFIIIIDIIIDQKKKCKESFSSNHIDYTPLKKKLLEHKLISLSCENCDKSLDNSKYFLTFSQIGTKKLPLLQKEENIITDIHNYKNKLKENSEKCNLDTSIQNFEENITEEEEEKKVLIKKYKTCEYISRHKSYFKLLNREQNIFTLYGATEGDINQNSITMSEFLGVSNIIDNDTTNLIPKISTIHDEYIESNLYIEIISHDDNNQINIDGTIGKQLEIKNNKLNFKDNTNFEIILFFIVNEQKKYITWEDIIVDENKLKILSLTNFKDHSLKFTINFI